MAQMPKFQKGGYIQKAAWGAVLAKVAPAALQAIGSALGSKQSGGEQQNAQNTTTQTTTASTTATPAQTTTTPAVTGTTQTTTTPATTTTPSTANTTTATKPNYTMSNGKFNWLNFAGDLMSNIGGALGSKQSGGVFDRNEAVGRKLRIGGVDEDGLMDNGGHTQTQPRLWIRSASQPRNGLGQFTPLSSQRGGTIDTPNGPIFETDEGYIDSYGRSVNYEEPRIKQWMNSRKERLALEDKALEDARFGKGIQLDTFNDKSWESIVRGIHDGGSGTIVADTIVLRHNDDGSIDRERAKSFKTGLSRKLFGNSKFDKINREFENNK